MAQIRAESEGMKHAEALEAERMVQVQKEAEEKIAEAQTAAEKQIDKLKREAEAKIAEINKELHSALDTDQEGREERIMEVLESLPLLEKVPANKKKILGKAMDIKTFQNGEHIITEGEIGDAFYILEQGTVQVKKTPEGGNGPVQILDTLKQGTAFGELALINKAPRAASIVAVGTVKALELKSEDFQSIIGSMMSLMKFTAWTTPGEGYKPDKHFERFWKALKEITKVDGPPKAARAGGTSGGPPGGPPPPPPPPPGGGPPPAPPPPPPGTGHRQHLHHVCCPDSRHYERLDLDSMCVFHFDVFLSLILYLWCSVCMQLHLAVAHRELHRHHVRIISDRGPLLFVFLACVRVLCICELTTSFHAAPPGGRGPPGAPPPPPGSGPPPPPGAPAPPGQARAPAIQQEREIYTFERMHDEFKKILAGTNMVEEDVEFFAMSLLALLKQQQKIQGIPEQVCRRKFTTLFRVYDPLLQQLYDRPALLIRTFLLWENNFFARIPKLHHRDEARENNMELIFQLIDTNADTDEVEDTVQATADEKLEKIEQQRLKSEQIKERKRAEGKKAKKKPKSTFEMTDEQGDAEKSALTHILGYIKELDSAIIDTEAALKERGQAPAQRVDDEQAQTKQYIQRMVADTSTVLDKARAAGIRPEDMDGKQVKDDAELSDTAAAGPALPTASTIRII